MSESKWVNRNLRAGKSLQPSLTGESGYRRDYVHKRSSRAPVHKSGRGKRKSRRRHRLRLRFANRLSILATLLVCLLTVAAITVYLRFHKAQTPAVHFVSESSRVLAKDNGPDPIIHNPGEIVEKFLLAHTTGELASLGRMDDNSPALVREFGNDIIEWNKGRVQWTGLHEAKANGLIFSAFEVEHASLPRRIIYVVQTPFGPRVDVGAFLGWCSEDWDSLATGKVTRATTVRARISRVPYYNFRYQDEKTWQSYRLTPLDGGTHLYGYVQRDTTTARALNLLLPDRKPFLAIISLDDGEAGSNNRQFRISRVLAAGWAMGTTILEDSLPKLIDQPAYQPPEDDPKSHAE